MRTVINTLDPLQRARGHLSSGWRSRSRDRRDGMGRGRRDDRSRDYHDDRGRPDARDRGQGWGGQRDHFDRRRDGFTELASTRRKETEKLIYGAS